MSLSLRYGFDGMTDPDAAAYVAAVEAADGQLLEYATGQAINDFVVGCKNDRIWTAIKASCILAGARTLSGALVPLVGTAPTNNNFVSGDYNRKTGLLTASGKFINSNRNNNTDPQNNQHLSVYLTGSIVSGIDARIIGGSFGGGSGFTAIEKTSNIIYFYSRSNTQGGSTSALGKTGFIGITRNSSTSFIARFADANATYSNASTTPTAGNITTAPYQVGISQAFYSIGESLDLALLDTRVTALMSALAAAIP